MAKAALKAPKKKAAPTKTKAKIKAKPLKLETRKVSIDRHRGGKVSTHSVVVQKRPEVAPVPSAPRPAARPMKLVGTPLEISRIFFDSHGLPTLSSALPSVLPLDDFAQRAATEGFNRTFVFPATGVQRKAFELMAWQLLRVPSPALEPSQQYNAPWIFDLRDLAEGITRGRPDGAYALAITDAPVPEDTYDRKAGQLETRFQALSQNSLTVFEYLVLQRLFAEEFQDHRFDQDTLADGHPSGWQWLLDTRSARGSVHACWSVAKRRVEIGAVPPGNFNERRGAHPTLIRPL